jgi:hypothetical protein
MQGILALERHGARALRGLRVRIASRFLALAAAVSLNHETGARQPGAGRLRGLSRGTTHLGVATRPSGLPSPKSARSGVSDDRDEYLTQPEP